MFADVLDAPVSKLAVRDDVDVCQDFFNARALILSVEPRGLGLHGIDIPCLPQGSFQIYSGLPSFQSRPVQPHATFPEALR